MFALPVKYFSRPHFPWSIDLLSTSAESPFFPPVFNSFAFDRNSKVKDASFEKFFFSNFVVAVVVACSPKNFFFFWNKNFFCFPKNFFWKCQWTYYSFRSTPSKSLKSALAHQYLVSFCLNEPVGPFFQVALAESRIGLAAALIMRISSVRCRSILWRRERKREKEGRGGELSWHFRALDIHAFLLSPSSENTRDFLCLYLSYFSSSIWAAEPNRKGLFSTWCRGYQSLPYTPIHSV